MKIVCDACQAKYSISDDKVRGKVFKIRCKKCSNVIVVRGVGDAAPEPAPLDDAGDAIWHLVIDQGQVGPMTIADIERRLAAGEIDADTFAWREGFDDWQPLAQLDELASLVRARDATTPRGTLEGDGLFGASGSAASDALFGSGAAGAAGDELFAASASSGSTSGSAASGGAGGGLFAGAATSGSRSEHNEDDAFYGSRNAASEPAAQRLRGERNESSVLFSLNNLAQIANPRPPAGTPAAGSSAAAAGVASGEGSGLIDIRSMASAYLGGAGAATSKGATAGIGTIDDLPVFGTGGFSEPAVLVPVATRTSNSRLLYVMIAAVALLAIAAVVMVVMLMHKSPAQVAALTPASANGSAVTDLGSTHTTTPATNASTAATTSPTQATVDAARSSTTAAINTTTANVNVKTAAQVDKATTQKNKTAATTGKTGTATKIGTVGKTGADATTVKTGTPAKTGADATTDKAPSKTNECDEVACLVNSEPLCCRHPNAHGGDPNPPKKVVDTSLPEKLVASDVTSSMGAVKARVIACGDRSSAKGTIRVHVKVGADGHVGTASIDASPDPALTACVVAAVKKASFPKTQTGGSFNIPYTF